MMLADMGAEVVRIERITGSGDTPEDSPLLRNRRSMALDLKSRKDAIWCWRWSRRRTHSSRGFGRESRNGWDRAGRLFPELEARLRTHDRLGADGPLAQSAGHDLNYIGLTGCCIRIGPDRRQPGGPLK